MALIVRITREREMSEPANNAPSASSDNATLVIEGTNAETPTTGGTKVTLVTGKTTSPNVKIVKNAGNVGQTVSTAGSASAANKDNFIVVVNKVDSRSGNAASGEIKVMSKPLTILGSPTGGTAAILKAGVGKTLVKVQKASPQGSLASAVGKRNIVVAARPGGGNQFITCSPAAQQPSTPVILTQKVSAGGIVTSPVVSTGGVNAAIANMLGGAKIVTTTAQAAQSPPQQKLQDVRVDNWGNYCLQRLQNMYDRGDYCDLTLRFHSSQEIKVSN